MKLRRLMRQCMPGRECTHKFANDSLTQIHRKKTNSGAADILRLHRLARFVSRVHRLFLGLCTANLSSGPMSLCSLQAMQWVPPVFAAAKVVLKSRFLGTDFGLNVECWPHFSQPLFTRRQPFHMRSNWHKPRGR